MDQFAVFLPGFLAAYAILLVGASSPGPSVAMLVGVATSHGRAPAMVATAGIATGSLTINILTMLGVGLILSHAAWAMSALRVIGGAYLLWLAWGAFRKAVHPPTLLPDAAHKRDHLQYFMLGYLLQVTNPKAIVFWLAIASIDATRGGSTMVVIAFITGAFAISFLCHGAWAVLLSSGPVRRGYLRCRRWIEAALGVFFSFAAIKLVTSEY